MSHEAASDLSHNPLLHEPATVFTKAIPRKVIVSQKQIFWKNLLKRFIRLGASFVLSQALFPGGIYPAGAGFGISSRSLPWLDKLLICIGLFGGVLYVKGIGIAAVSSGALMVGFLINGVYHHQKGSDLSVLVTWIIWSGLDLGLLLVSHMLPSISWNLAFEKVIVLILAFIFQQGLNNLADPLKRSTKLAHTTLGLLTVLIACGTHNLTFDSVKFIEIIPVISLLFAAYLGGGGVGAAMGISLAIALGLSGGGLLTLAVLYGVTGFLGGFLRELGKWGTIGGVCIGLYLVSEPLRLSLVSFPDMMPWSIGMASFIVFPNRYLSQISNYFSNDNSKLPTPEKQQRLREVISNRLNGLAEIFNELATSFNSKEQNQGLLKIDLYSLLDQVCIKNCQHCNGYESCWGENFYSTYREVFDLIALAELYGAVDTSNLKGRLAKSCFQQYKLLETINHLFEKCMTDQSWQSKLDENNNFLAFQLQGIANIINNLAVEIDTDASFKSEIEDNLRCSLNRIGIHTKEVMVVTFREASLEIQIKQAPCNQKRACQYLVAPLIGKLLGENYTVWERNCQLDHGECSYCLTPERNYEVRTSVCKLAKHENESSGDNHILQSLKDGHFVAILSDGMGHGSKAAQESNATVKILEKLLETGIDRDVAVRMVNSFLLLRSPEETFATVDLVLIDLYHPRAEFIKIGAAATYVKRGREVRSIKSTSLPAGILNTVDVERTVLDLEPGDLVILVTDGVVDSKPVDPGKEDWIIRALRQVEVVGPESLGEYLLNLARINQDGAVKDDMTVVVLQLNEREIGKQLVLKG